MNTPCVATTSPGTRVSRPVPGDAPDLQGARAWQWVASWVMRGAPVSSAVLFAVFYTKRAAHVACSILAARPDFEPRSRGPGQKSATSLVWRGPRWVGAWSARYDLLGAKGYRLEIQLPHADRREGDASVLSAECQELLARLRSLAPGTTMRVRGRSVSLFFYDAFLRDPVWVLAVIEAWLEWLTAPVD